MARYLWAALFVLLLMVGLSREQDGSTARSATDTAIDAVDPPRVVTQPAVQETVSPPKAQTTRTVYVTASALILRAGAGQDHKRLDAFPHGTKLAALSAARGDWIKVRSAAGTEGWMHRAYLSEAPPKAAPVRTPAREAKTQVARAQPSTETLRREIVNTSIARYPGSCACPYHRDRAGRRCGRRSAWSRAGGHSPLCYPKEVTREMLASWQR